MLSSDQATQDFVPSDLENSQNWILQPFFANLFHCLLYLTVKRLLLVSSWNFPYIIVLDSGVPGVSVAISLCFSPRKIPLMVLLLQPPWSLLHYNSQIQFLGKATSLLPDEIWKSPGAVWGMSR